MRLTDLLLRSRVYDLAQPYFVGMPHYPTHPPFLHSLTRLHGDFVGPGGVSSASDGIALGSHVGTHIDALSHFSCGGKLFGGQEAANAQTYRGMTHNAVDTIAPIVRKAVLLDIAGLEGSTSLPKEFVIGPEHFEAAIKKQKIGAIEPGSLVLLRTGWGSFFEDAARYLCQAEGPGPRIEGARWLSSHKLFAAGSDTILFEYAPDPALPVHVHLLVDSGIHIIEVLNLEELARDGISEFLFIAAPLKIRGGTGAPLRPLALVEI